MSPNQKTVLLKTFPVCSGLTDSIAVLSLNRPQTANAINSTMIDELINHLKTLESLENIRALVLLGRGKHFSAGADLEMMKNAARFSYMENKEDANRLLELFERLYSLAFPTLALVRGSVFGGAVGLVACCDIAIAQTHSRFCLSEVKLGILPAIILPYLALKLSQAQLRRLALTGREFDADEAKHSGLISVICPEDAVDQTIHAELNAITSCGPMAQRSLKKLLHHIVRHNVKQGPHTVEAISMARTGEEGQKGLEAFFLKQKPPWSLELERDWKLDDFDKNP